MLKGVIKNTGCCLHHHHALLMGLLDHVVQGLVLRPPDRHVDHGAVDGAEGRGISAD